MPAAFAYLALCPRIAATSEVERMVAVARKELAGFTASRGYWLSGVFDVQGRTETGLYAMLTALRRGRAVAVVVPDLGHLRHAGCLAGADLPTASRYLRARLLSMHPEPGEHLVSGPAGGRPGHGGLDRATPSPDWTWPWWSRLEPDGPTRAGVGATSGRARGAHR